MKKSYHVKFLTNKETDIDLAEAVCKKCEDYYVLEAGRAATREDAAAVILELPEGKTRYDKFAMAILDEANAPIGLIDVVADYPKSGEWIIGLLLLVPEARNSGMGRVLHEVIREWAQDSGANSLRVGVLKSNESAAGFWRHLGYEHQGEKTIQIGGRENEVEVLTRETKKA
ncbi:GNAT family N-acetyltransferase [Listeria aquatica]|uniref:N-acetyltransferase domain-containing protein n=1 Tax=Listeria aquatica FSL S10-1188 TaxID=1265818 RepID=W7BAU8_9LIST|nr:GNAT family N-acetyltransferase [Listeria aquatica]EUJ21795.1 hypothetical protein MAQA_00250 [Listeria aquatica FSL S10-1188]